MNIPRNGISDHRKCCHLTNCPTLFQSGCTNFHLANSVWGCWFFFFFSFFVVLELKLRVSCLLICCLQSWFLHVLINVFIIYLHVSHRVCVKWLSQSPWWLMLLSVFWVLTGYRYDFLGEIFGFFALLTLGYLLLNFNILHMHLHVIYTCLYILVYKYIYTYIIYIHIWS
jgi:hypothetical protein